MKLSQVNTREHKVKYKFYDLGGYDFYRMTLYLADMKTLLQKQSKVIEREYKRESAKHPMEAQFIDEWYQRKRYDNEIHFLGTLYNTSLVATSTIFEVVLKNVCRYGAYKTHNKFVEPKSPVIERCKKFLEQIGVKLEQVEEIWIRISSVLQVRHLITHAGATYKPIVYDPKEKSVVEHIKQNSESILVTRPRTKKPRPFLIIGVQYIECFIDDCERYLRWIIEQLPEKRPKRSKKRR